MSKSNSSDASHAVSTIFTGSTHTAEAYCQEFDSLGQAFKEQFNRAVLSRQGERSPEMERIQRREDHQTLQAINRLRSLFALIEEDFNLSGTIKAREQFL